MAKPGMPRKVRKQVKWESLPKPQPVAAIWESAPKEEQEAAHRTAAVILQYWSGRLTKAEAAMQLEVAPLRVWQLSRLGLSGMVCGLLKQPQRRAAGAPSMTKKGKETDWEKKARELQRQLDQMTELVEVLSELPGNREKLEARLKEKLSGGKKAADSTSTPSDRRVAPEE